MIDNKFYFVLAISLLVFNINFVSAVVATGFDYSVGDRDVTQANDGDGWYNAQDFRTNNHLGEDWNSESGGNSDCGTIVYAVANGQVVASADYGGNWGNVIIVRHTLPNGNQVESLYGHLNRRDVSNGNNIRKGQQIGTIGDGYSADGCSGNNPDSRTGYWAHVHLEIRYSNSRSWGQPGPGYSTDSTGWTDPSNFINSNRNIPYPVDKTLIKKEGDSPIYWLQNSIYYWILNENTFNLMSPIWQWGNVSEYEVNDFNNGIRNNPNFRQGPNFVSDNLLIKKTSPTIEPTVFFTHNNQRRAFFNYDVLIDPSYGFFEANIIGVTQNLRDNITSGDLVYAVGYDSGRISLFRDAFNRVGGTENLGYARTTTQPWGTGQIQYFKKLSANSAIVYNPNLNYAYHVYGAIYTKYTARGANIYGFPIGDEAFGIDSSVSGARATYQRFTGGNNVDTSINHHQTGARAGLTIEVHGPILNKWALMNYGAGCAGLPISDVYASGGGLKADFENGYIYWDGQRTIASCEPTQDECMQGTTRCQTSSIKQTCGNYDVDIWLEWGNDFSCAFGCSNGQCNPAPSCTDEIKNQDETDKDCGGICVSQGRSCENGKICSINTDCQSNYCNPNKICSTPSCTDGWQNQNEQRIDCGGPCPVCPSLDNNNEYTSANILNINSQGSETAHNNSDRIDWWVIRGAEIGQDGSLTIILDSFRTSNQDFDLYVYAEDNLGTPLCSSLSSSNPVEECRIQTFVGKSYYIKVEAYSGTGSYRIQNTFTLHLDRPGIVVNLREKSHSDHVVCIEWNEPVTGGEANIFVIRENIFSSEIARPVREFCRADFPADTDVIFTVKACNSAGCSDSSGIMIRTDPEIGAIGMPKVTDLQISAETVNNEFRVLISGMVENPAGVANNPDFSVRVEIIPDVAANPVNSGFAVLSPIDNTHTNFQYLWVPDPSQYDKVLIVKAIAFDGNERGNKGKRIIIKALTDKKICVDPGHGGTDPGNLGFDDMVYNPTLDQWEYDGNAGKPNEADFNLLIALELRNLLDNIAEINMTRETDIFLELSERTTIANNAHCDIFVSIHQNAANSTGDRDPEPYAHGTETYYCKNSDKPLAENIQRKLIESIGRRDRHAKNTCYFVLQNSHIPAALTEVAFSTNDTEFYLLNTAEFRQNAARGIFQGIQEYFARRGEVELEILTRRTNTSSPFKILAEINDQFGELTNELNNRKLDETNFEVYLTRHGIAPTISDKRTFSVQELSLGIYEFTINPVGFNPGEILDLYITAFDPVQPEGQQIADIAIAFDSVLIGPTVIQCGNITGSEEFIVNSYTNSHQQNSKVESDGRGNFIIVWESIQENNGADMGIYAQRFGANGNRIGSEFNVNSYLNYDQRYPAIAMNSVGNFVIVWESNSQFEDKDIFGQRYDFNGNKIGGEFMVNTFTQRGQINADVTIAADNSFVVIWQSHAQDGSGAGIYAQRFDANGNKIGDEFRVNSFTLNEQQLPEIVIDFEGNFVVVWQSWGQDGSLTGIYAQRFDKNGNKIGEEFRVNTETNNYQQNPDIAMDSNGNFIVVWGSEGQDSSGEAIYAQKFDSNGNKIGEEFRVNTGEMNDQELPSIDMDTEGNFVVTWTDWRSGNGDIYAQRFDKNGNKIREEFRVNDYTNERQWLSDIALSDNGGFIITWDSFMQDGSEYGVYGKLFGCILDSDNDGFSNENDNCPNIVNPQQGDGDNDGIGDACDPQTCGNGIQEYLEECDDNNLMNNDSCSTTCKIENLPLLVTIFSPQSKTYTTQNIILNFSINKPGTCFYSLNNGRSNSTMANVGNTVFIAFNTTLRDGSYTARAYCNDTFGNKNNTVNVAFNKDTRAPAISIRSPTKGFHNISMTHLQVMINEPGICNYSFNNGRTNNTMQNTANKNFTDNVILTNGPYTLNYYCTDVHGNLRIARMRFSIDTIIPKISYGTRTAPNNAIVSGKGIFVDVLVTEINEANITFSLFNLTQNINSSTFTNKKRFINFANINSGIYTYNVTIIDKANNKNTTETRLIQLI